ncbi:MAG TPA: LysR family transcriptional regulator [Polyangiaceae bacterium]|nr:LysR family transcriptional regulator [Polyangiaceae bacterium]
MDREQLAAFVHVARRGSFTQAAVALGVGQPAVSARIRALEERVGGALFARGRRARLTVLGESFLPFARRALEVIDEGLEVARLTQIGKRGRVTLGSLASLTGGLVGPAVGALLRENPDVACLVRAGEHERIVELLVDGVVELGVVAWPCAERVAADLRPLLVFREPVVLVAGPTHPLARRARVVEQDVVRLGRPLFRLRWWPEHDSRLLALAERAGPAVELAMEAARSLARGGAGVGFFARTYVAEDLKMGTLVEVPVQHMAPIERGSALVRRGRSGPLSPAAAHLIEALRRQAAALGLLAPTPSRGRRDAEAR